MTWSQQQSKVSLQRDTLTFTGRLRKHSQKNRSLLLQAATFLCCLKTNRKSYFALLLRNKKTTGWSYNSTRCWSVSHNLCWSVKWSEVAPCDVVSCYSASQTTFRMYHSCRKKGGECKTKPDTPTTPSACLICYSDVFLYHKPTHTCRDEISDRRM